jgi:5-methylcytosine-specific restriction enzyme A
MTPRRPASPCTADPRCPNLVDIPGPCPQHSAERERLRRQHETWRNYGDGWTAARARVLAEEPTCRTCGAPSAQVDHITPIRDGGPPLARDNLQALCHPCHSRKTARENRFGGSHQ